MADISIVIISWKMKPMLCDLLHSIARHTTGITYELIIVDNHSGDGTSDMIRTEFPDAILIENSENRGVAPSRNQALKRATGRYIFILDADMLFLENSAKAMVEFMEKTPDAGICGCKLVSAEYAVQLNARRYPSPVAFVMRRLARFGWARRSAILRRHEMSDWDRSDVRDVDYLIGACQLVRREAFEQIGLLDENIFYGPEDVDYCLRMYRHGWKVYYYPFTRIIHYEQRITKKKFFSKISFYHLRGIFYLLNKYHWKLTRT